MMTVKGAEVAAVVDMVVDTASVGVVATEVAVAVNTASRYKSFHTVQSSYINHKSLGRLNLYKNLTSFLHFSDHSFMIIRHTMSTEVFGNRRICIASTR